MWEYMVKIVMESFFKKNERMFRIEKCSLERMFTTDQLSLPPHCLVGNEAFGLKWNLMKPFPQMKARQDWRKMRYNYRLCRVRGVVENTFSILAQKWRLYNKPLEVAKVVVMARCVLHNFLRTKDADTDYFECLEEDNEEPWGGAFSMISDADFKSGSRYAIIVPKRFVDFFNK